MNKYVYEGQLKSAAYKDASEFAPSSHSHAAKDLSFSEKNTNYTNASNIQDAIEDIDGKLWEIEGAAEEAETNAKAYADSIKNSLLNGAGAAYDTLKELGELIDENHDAITVLEQVATNKADKTEIPIIDTEINSESQNPVQNKVVKEYIDEKIAAIPQSDWNQNDPNGAGYIENRPFGTEIDETTLVEEQAITIENGYANLTPVENYWDSLIIGAQYIVIFDGISYSGTVYEDSDESYRTDFETEDGYSIAIYDACSLYCNLTGEHTIKMSIVDEKINTLDEKYISYKPGKITTGNAYNITDSEGNEIEVVASHGAEVFNEYVYNKATGVYSHAEGWHTTASGARSHAEGNYTTASGEDSHSEGDNTKAYGIRSHTEGWFTTASGNTSHAEGYRTKASGNYQHVQGKYNIEDTENKYAHIVGNGKSEGLRSNAHTVDWDGNAWFSGDVYVGGTSQNDENAKKLATEDFVGNKAKELQRQIVNIEKNQYNILESAGLIGRDETTITDLSSYNPTFGFITSTGTWGNINEKYQFIVIPISNTGSTLSITANDSYAVYFAGLRSYTTPTDKSIVDFSEASGWTSRLTVPKSTTKQYNVPDDVKYIILFVVYNTSNCRPASFYLNIPYGKGRVDILEEKVRALENDYGLKWLALGDSITEGYYSVLNEGMEDTESHKSVDECYCAWIAKMKGFNLDNRGVGGSGWLKRGTTAAPKLNAREQIDALNDDGSYVIDFAKYDLCTIMWGVNDWKGSQNLGVFEDGVNPETESVYGNMRYVIETILSRNPNIKLIIITPVNCRQDTLARPSSADNNWGIGFEFGGHTLDDYYDAIKEVCEYYGIEMIDMLHNSVINRINAETLLPDKVHPSLEAHRKIGLDLAGKILFGN